MNHHRAVLWDMDGTIIDSADYHWRAWREILAQESFDLTPSLFAKTFGQRSDEALRYYFGNTLSQNKIDNIVLNKEVRYRQLLKEEGIELLPGVVYWLEKLSHDGWLQALATSAPRLNVSAITEMTAIEHYFQAIVSAEDAHFGKPDPQIFLTAAAKLNTLPARAIVIEDSPVGIIAAHRGGMKAIGVLSSQPSLAADYVVERLDQLPSDIFEKLLINNH